MHNDSRGGTVVNYCIGHVSRITHLADEHWRIAQVDVAVIGATLNYLRTK